MEGLFMRASEKQGRLVIFYMDGEQKVTQRYIKVLKVKNGYILAYCYYRKKVRTFKIDHILSVGHPGNGADAS